MSLYKYKIASTFRKFNLMYIYIKKYYGCKIYIILYTELQFIF